MCWHSKGGENKNRGQATEGSKQESIWVFYTFMIHSLSPALYKPPCLFCTYFPALQERHSQDYEPKLKPDSKVTTVKSQSSPTLTSPVFGTRRGMQESLHQVVWVVVVQDTAQPLRAGMGGRHVQGQPVIH